MINKITKSFKNIKGFIHFNSTLYNSSYNKKLEQVLTTIMNIPYSQIDITIGDCHIIINSELGNGKLWNANKPYAWLDDGNFGDISWSRSRASKSTMFKFDTWLSGYKEYQNNADNLKSFHNKHGKEIVEIYQYLKDNRHHSHTLILDYINDIKQLKKDCEDVCNSVESENIIEEHVSILLNISRKAKFECEELLYKIKIKEDEEEKVRKDNYKKVLSQSSEILKSKYKDYVEQWIE